MTIATGPSNLSLPRAHVHVWLTNADEVPAERLLQLQELLSAEELVRMRAYRFPEDQRLFLVAHAQLRRVLSKYAAVKPNQWHFTTTRYGRPRISAGPYAEALHFNLSHSAGLVAIAVARQVHVGVDVESLARPGELRGLAASALTLAEAERMATLDDREYRREFLRLWTLKEAYAKAQGLGLSLPFTEFSFNVGSEGIELIDDRERSSDWTFRQLRPTTTHILALAARGASEIVLQWDRG